MDRPFSLFNIHSLSSHIPRQTEAGSQVGTTSLALLYLWLAFQLFDQIFLPILIATFLLAKSVKRHPTVVNVCMTWIISAIVSSLLMYAGKHVGPEPPKMLCTLQASLLDGVLPMTSVAILTLMFQVNSSIRNPKEQACKMRIYALLIAPYFAFFSFSMSAAILAVRKPEIVNRERRFFYCSFDSPISDAFAIFSALALLMALGYAVSIIVFLRKNWRLLRQAGSFDLQFLSRVAVFGVYVFLALVFSVLSIVAPQSPLPDLFAASVGTALFLILSTQPDVWRAWLRRSKPIPPSVRHNWNPLDMEDSKVHNLKDRYTIKGFGGAKGEVEEANVVHVNLNMVPLQDRSRYRPASVSTDDSTGSRDAGKGVNVHSLSRFARPGMI